MKNKYIIIDSNDNCATALEDIRQNENINLKDKSIRTHHKIPLGHKFAINNIEKEDYIIKYGEIIGIATEKISEGDWIHTHNIKSPYLKGEKDG